MRNCGKLSNAGVVIILIAFPALAYIIYNVWVKVEVKGSSSIKSLSSPFPRPPCLQINQGVLSVYDDWKAIQLAPKDRCPKGLVVLLHTCGYSGMECWRYLKDAGVPSQHTLPIESRIAHSLHSNGYMLLSLSSYVNQAKNKCWHSDDTPHVAKVIRAVHTNVTSQTNQVLPIYAIGIFKGGFYLGLSAWSLYATYKIKLDGIFIMNSGIWHKDYKKPQFPPVFFIDMNRNGLTALHNNKTVQEMIASGLRSVQYSSDPFPISDDYFFTQGVLSKIDSQTLFQALQADPKYLWPGSQILMIDPSENIHLKNFKALVTKALPEYASTDALKGTHSPLLQALRKAYGFRETNDEFIPQMIAWMEKSAVGK